jgi:hypothetical protein
MGEGSNLTQQDINNIVNAVAYTVQEVLTKYGVQAISNAVVNAVVSAVQNTLKPRTEVPEQVVDDASALLSETPDVLSTEELPAAINEAVAMHEKDFVELVSYNKAVNSIVYNTSFKGVVVKPANYEKSLAKFYVLHDKYPYLEIDVNGHKVHILARNVVIKGNDASTPYNARSYLVLEVSVTKPGEKQEKGEEVQGAIEE